EGTGFGLLCLPVEPVAIGVRLPRNGWFSRNPSGNDIVVNLVVGRNLDELHRPLAPIPYRLHPEARPALVGHTIQVMVEVAIALHEAEASRVHIGKCRSDGAWWIVERPPNTLAGAGPHS